MLGTRRIEARVGGLERAGAAVQLGLADEILLPQLTVAPQVALGEPPLGLELDDLRLGARGGQLQVARVQARDRLPGFHDGADFGQALHHLAADAKTQSRF